jgi:hypothetical protein
MFASNFILEDFPLSDIPNVEGLIQHFIPCLVVKVNDIQVPTTKNGLESGFGRIKFENPTPQEVFNCMPPFNSNLDAGPPSESFTNSSYVAWVFGHQV